MDQVGTKTLSAYPDPAELVRHFLHFNPTVFAMQNPNLLSLNLYKVEFFEPNLRCDVNMF